MKRKVLFQKITSGIGIILSGFFAFLGIYEFYKIRILKQTEFYPFGGEGPVPYYYQTAELYSSVNLIYGITFASLFAFGIWNWKTNKIDGIKTLGLSIILILIQIFHGFAE